MCLAVYMASDRDQPLIPWDKHNPKFYVSVEGQYIEQYIEKVRRQFSKPKIYYIGSDEGCGCGFRQAADELNDDSTQSKSKQDNQRRLYDYLMASLSHEDFIEMFSCWGGDEQNPIQTTRQIKLTQLLDDTFFFSEMELTRVMK